MIILKPTEALEKGLVPVRRMITRGGKTFMTTVYVGSTKKDEAKRAKSTGLAVANPRRVTRASSLALMRNAQEVIDYAPDDKRALEKVLAYQRKHGPSDPPSMYELLEIAEQEVQYSRENSEDSGEDWYDEDIARTRATLTLGFPEFATDTSWDFFLMILSVQSAGQEVAPNMRFAVKAYQGFKETGQIPSKDPSTGKVIGRFERGMVGLNRLYNSFGGSIPDMVAYVNGVSTVADVNANGISRMGKSETGATVSGRADEDAFNSMILGEKIGMFYQSARGTGGAVAVDRWAIRSFYRWTGRLRESRAVKDAGTIEDTMTPHDRRNVEYVMQTVGDRLGLPSRKVQAVLWYYEKRLYKKLGITPTPEGGYSEEAEKVIRRLFPGKLSKSRESSLIDEMIARGEMPTFQRVLQAIMGVTE